MQEPRIRTIQQTSKPIKFGQMVGALLAMIAIAMIMIHVFDESGGDDSPAIALWMLACLLGIVINQFFRFLAWWFYG